MLRCWEYRDALLLDDDDDDSYCCLFEVDIRFVDLDDSGDDVENNLSSSSIYSK